ncbi:unnamed protein product [Effrenium voratum]|uniref:C-type lectin domain-containing protein n=1 Tax=Effrenium voratum TaxID=2562239 RepID=A0AA36I7K7_9DINO|nr:unnamed protein product [Effrenium voratum]CAJ1450937.1 unnamed protein product [Effrenium voratum]
MKLLLLLPGASATCLITAKVCANFPEFNRTQFRDTFADLDAGDAAACLKRAEDFHHWCGNAVDGDVRPVVAASFGERTWFYEPGACDAGWSQWQSSCFRFHLDLKTWAEAEAICQEQESHLASVHSREENSFIHQLSHGLTVWIGYTDLDHDSHYTWSDNTQDDFTNFAKNCSGEVQAGCSREEVQQQWYLGHQAELSPFVCKRSARLPSRWRNVSADRLLSEPWERLRASFSAVAKPPRLDSASISVTSHTLSWTQACRERAVPCDDVCEGPRSSRSRSERSRAVARS